MKLKLTLFLLVCTSTVWSQTSHTLYSYLNPSGGTTPTYSPTVASTAWCVSARSAVPTSAPFPSCNVATGFVGGTVLVEGAQMPVAAGVPITFSCNGAGDYLSCTLTITPVGVTGVYRPPPSNAVSHTQDSGLAQGQGMGAAQGCGKTDNGSPSTESLKIGFQQPLVVGVPTTFTFAAQHLGGGYCIVDSLGFVRWGDGTEDPIPGETLQADDGTCAKKGSTRIHFSNAILTHQYDVPGPVKIQAHMGLTLKNAGSPSGSWFCYANRWDQFQVNQPPHVSKHSLRCYKAGKRITCPHSSRKN
jgi:hypothetical protein